MRAIYRNVGVGQVRDFLDNLAAASARRDGLCTCGDLALRTACDRDGADLAEFAIAAGLMAAGFAAPAAEAKPPALGVHAWTNSIPRAFLKDRHLRLYSGGEGERVLFSTEWKKARVAAQEFSYTGAMLIVSLSSLMRTGVSLRGSIERAMKFSSPWLRWHLRETLRALSSGNATQFGAAFRTGLLTPDMEDRVQEASERRDPVAAFVKIGVGSLDRIARSVEDAAGKLNNLLIVLTGLGLGAMIMGFFATVQSISTGIK